MIRRRSASIGIGLLACLGLLAVSCSDDGGSDTADPPTTSPTTTTATTEAPTTTAVPEDTTTTVADTTTTSTTTTAPSGECPGDGALPDNAQFATLSGADVDGDGDVDTVHAYATGDGGTPDQWWLQVSFAGGGGSTYAVESDSVLLSGVRANDGVDLNGDGTEEFFAKVGAGASVEIISIFDVIDCTLVPVMLDGAPVELATGGSANNVSGFRCLDIDANNALDFILVFTGNRLNGTGEFEITAIQYALEDGELNLILADGLGMNENDPGFLDFGGEPCPNSAIS